MSGQINPLLGPQSYWCMWLSSPFPRAGVTWEYCWSYHGCLHTAQGCGNSNQVHIGGGKFAGKCGGKGHSVGGGGAKWHPPALLFLEKSPKDPCPSSTHFKIKKQISLPYTQAFFKLLLCCISAGLFIVLFKGGDSVSSHPFGSAEPNPLIFKVPGVKPH
ncbi:unnamed protein product [Nyctereutes procyonoides]|uniref:(raccoon dog) hypothetical protein n=1 Tax=Nyctereutes procyonoides TaxID=34880 RepID=A0A811YZ05_NYCPR|nr:unnamed protein product [Nyctereutes procyonoides]